MMINITNTPNMTGVLLAGDSEDFEALYDALHIIVGPEETAFGLAEARMRVLGLCYDLRHARMGNRNVVFHEHGLDAEQMKYLAIVGPTHNLYLSFETYWPEMLYIVFVLNEFIESYERRPKTHTWDENIAIVRLFQSKVLKLAGETMTDKQFASFKKRTDGTKALSYSFYANLYTQYVDYLNLLWIAMDKEERQKKLSIFAKRLNQHTTDYEKLKKRIDEAAEYEEVHPSEIGYGDYEAVEIVW